MPRRAGSLHLFSAFGIDVFVHWTWFVVAYLFYSMRGSVFGEGWWFVLTYGALFGIVLMHEFGHALACRSVGGRAEQIVLWPLGGVAYVEPPQRPGAVLWSIVAGPLVNVVLVPITVGLSIVASATLPETSSLLQVVQVVTAINLTLLVFNMMPIYPLDGGQTLWAILWFFMGRAKSLKVASTIGLCIAVFTAVFLIASGALLNGGAWLFILAVFVAWQAWEGRKAAELMIKAEDGSWDRIRELARRLSEQPRS